MLIGIGSTILALVSFYFSKLLWKKGNSEEAHEHFINAFIDAFFNSLKLTSWLLPSFESYRSWAIFLWVAGVLLLLYGISLIILSFPS